jgi:hypothetical protein
MSSPGAFVAKRLYLHVVAFIPTSKVYLLQRLSLSANSLKNGERPANDEPAALSAAPGAPNTSGAVNTGPLASRRS